MRIADLPSRVEMLTRCTPEDRWRLISSLTPIELLAMDADFESWAHAGQREPSGEGWRTWLMMAGRGFGKTRAGAEWITRLATQRGRPVRIALVGATIDEVRKVMVEGESGLLAVGARHGKRPVWEPSLRQLRWPGGSIADAYSGENPDGLRGPQHDFAWCDELAKWARPEESWANLQMGLRAGPRPRALVTTTPRPLALLKRIEGGRWTVTTHGRTDENINLSEAFLSVMAETYGGTRLGRQELDGELIEEIEGALWTRALIEKCRVQFLPGTGRGTMRSMVEGLAPNPCQPLRQRSALPPPRAGEELRRVVVGVDPPASAEGDACGIVVCGMAREGKLLVLDDRSACGLSPEGWARAVVAAAEDWGAERVVAETNQGGEMVAATLRSVDAALPVRAVRARYGKAQRAEPVAALFESGKAAFAGAFPALEDELCGLLRGGGYEGPGRSPDRADAMVWAMTELMPGPGAAPRVRGL